MPTIAEIMQFEPIELTEEYLAKLREKAETLMALVSDVDNTADGAVYAAANAWAEVCSPEVVLALLDRLEAS